MFWSLCRVCTNQFFHRGIGNPRGPTRRLEILIFLPQVRVAESRTSTLAVMSGSTSTASPSWSPQSWRQKPVVQDVVYPTPSISSSSSSNAEQDSQPDPVTYKRKQQLEDVVFKLEKLPPIVSPTEVRSHTSSKCT